MSAGAPRDDLIKRIKELFGPGRITSTARRVGKLSPRADVFDILFKLGAFPWVKGPSVAAYRRSLPIPEVNRQILTAAFKLALGVGGRPKMPLDFEIYSAGTEAVDVRTTAKLIRVTLWRVDPPDVPHRFPRL